MSVGDVVIEGVQVGAVAVEVLEGGGLLQDAGDGAECAPLVRQEGGACRELHHVKAVRRHHRWVHVTVVHQVPHDLEKQFNSWGL